LPRRPSGTNTYSGCTEPYCGTRASSVTSSETLPFLRRRTKRHGSRIVQDVKHGAVRDGRAWYPLLAHARIRRHELLVEFALPFDVPPRTLRFCLTHESNILRLQGHPNSSGEVPQFMGLGFRQLVGQTRISAAGSLRRDSPLPNTIMRCREAGEAMWTGNTELMRNSWFTAGLRPPAQSQLVRFGWPELRSSAAPRGPQGTPTAAISVAGRVVLPALKPRGLRRTPPSVRLRSRSGQNGFKTILVESRRLLVAPRLTCGPANKMRARKLLGLASGSRLGHGNPTGCRTAESRMGSAFVGNVR